MDKQDMSANTNDYLARLGLNKDPFSAEADADFYYENPELMQRLDMIQHLIGFSNQMIFVSGPHGIGKTAMLDRLEYYAPDHWRICRIEANPMLSTPTLLMQLASGFGIEVHADSDEMFEAYSTALEEHISQLERAMHTPVVLIDNAHELPIDAFILLFGFMQHDSKAHLKMALFCEPQIKTMLDSPQLRALSDNITHHLDIPELNESRTREYLEKRLHYAGLEDEFPFTPDSVRRIHRDSEGIPAKINHLAEQALLDEESQNFPVVDEVLMLAEKNQNFDEDYQDLLEDNKLPPIGRRFQSWQIGAVALVMLLLAAVLWVTSKINDQAPPMIAEDVPLDLNPTATEEALTEMAAEEHSETASEDTSDIPISETTDLEALLANEDTLSQESPEGFVNEGLPLEQTANAADDPMDALVQELEEAHQASPSQSNTAADPKTEINVEIDEQGNAQVFEVKPVEAPQSALEQVSVSEPMAEPAPPVATTTPVPMPVQPEATTNKPTAAPEPATENTGGVAFSQVKGASWITQQSDDGFFLQLLGTHDMGALRKFFSENTMPRNTAWFTTQHDGKPWHVVVQGPFANRGAAVASISSLPEESRKRKPWPRSVASIKQIISTP